MRKDAQGLLVVVALAACSGSPPVVDAGSGGGAASGGGTASTGGGAMGGGSTTGGGSAIGGGGATGGGSATGGGGGGSTGVCTATTKTKALSSPSRGSAIAVTSDDTRIVAVNRDVGTVSVIPLSFDTAGLPVLGTAMELAVGGEPWQVVINGCDDTAYVVLRKDQRVVELNLTGTPAVGRFVAVGSEPTSLALTPHGHRLYVANWVDGTLSVIDPATMTLTATIDLNATLAPQLAAGLTPRAALAHPRAVTVTNGNTGDLDDSAETVLATEWFAVRTGPESAMGTAADHNRKGLLYKVATGSGTVSTVDLPAVADTGFTDAKGQTTGCFPNQIASVSLAGRLAYVTSTCASPVGPLGVFQKGACQADAACAAAFGPGSTCSAAPVGSLQTVCTLSCTIDTDCSPIAQIGDCVVPGGATKGSCKPTFANARTTTHPALTVVDLDSGAAVTTVLDGLFNAAGAARMPLLPTDVAFRPGLAYVSAEGADAVFELTLSATGTPAVGPNKLINVRKSNADALVRLPIGVATSLTRPFAFVADDGSRDVTALDLTAATVAGSPTDFRIAQASALPATNTLAESALIGKRAFTTGLGRWSLKGQAWGSCAACHVDGLSDGVTWYFDRGPRQTVSLDGTFASTSPDDQRILNWSADLDEVADFETNVRRVSGGVGALVIAVSNPLLVADRILTQNEIPAQQGLQGSSTAIAAATPVPPDGHPHSVVHDWLNVTDWLTTVRSPRRPTNLVPADVSAGSALWTTAGCKGCHGGPKWTVSKRFYTPDDAHNDAWFKSPHMSPSLSLIQWPLTSLPPSFPMALFPSTVSGSQTMRSGTPLLPAFEQLQCVLRPVGTIGTGAIPAGVSDSAVNVLEVREDMVTGAQGSGTTGVGDFTAGYNPPSLLGLQVGAPYFHAGNARTLEEVFGARFATHYQAVATFNPTAAEARELVAYLLSIDESEPTVTPPVAGSGGGDICYSP